MTPLVDILFIGTIAVIAAFIVGVISWLSSYVSASLAVRVGALDQPSGGRKIHTRPIPLWGGLGIAFALSIGIFAAFASGILSTDIRPAQIVGFVIGALILLIGGIWDDRHPLPPYVQIVFPALAAFAVIVSGTGIVQITNPASNGALSLVWGHWEGQIIGQRVSLSLPSDLLTFVWLLVATYAMKILDGLDGLVTGLTVIGAGIVGALSLSAAYFQPSVAILSGVVGGSFIGFLPRNAYPAKQFLGESGSTLAGFSLGVLAILSGAKIAIALAVLAIPIADILFVVAGRIRRHAPWFRGDDTHLHFRLLKAGVSHRAAVFLYWGIALAAGIAALGLQTRGKLFLIIALVLGAALASFFAGLRARAR